MAIGAAFETYAILTVGDGLVSQIPAVVISFASALLLSRGGTRGAMDLAVLGQLGSNPQALRAVALLMGLFALVPGLPFLPFILGAAVLGALAWREARKPKAETPAAETDPTASPAAPTLGDTLDLDDIHVEFASDLVGMVLDPATGLDSRITRMRTHIAESFGFIMPDIRITDSAGLEPGTYIIRIQGVEAGRGVLHPNMVLALVQTVTPELPSGPDVKEPVYGAPARWIQPRDREAATLQGATIISPAEVLATHLLELIKRNFPRLLTLKALRRILDEFTSLSNPERASANRRLLDELIPDRVPVELVHAVLRLLLAERVSIRNLPVILETLAELRSSTNQPETLCELVRQRLGPQLVSELRRPDGTVPLLQLAPEWEEIFAAHEVENDRGAPDVGLPPEAFEKLTTGLADQVASTAENGLFPAVITTARRRRFLSTLMAVKGLSNPVLSYEELGHEARPALVGVIPA